MRARAASSKPLRLPLLLAAGLLVWLFANGLLRPAAWRVPASYSIDALEMLARLKLCGDQGLAFLFDKTVPDLGAPGLADWSAYPMPDAWVFIGFGWIGRVIGLVPASNLALLFAQLSAVATFYVCCRALGHRAIFAAGGALLFGFCFYNCYRGLSHFSFALTFVVPAQLLGAWLVGRGRRMLQPRRWRIFSLATAVATGAGSPYFGFAYVLLLGAALVYQWATDRRAVNLRLGFSCLAAFAVTLLFFNYDACLAMLGAPSGLLQRNFAGTEIYGLRPIELFIPPAFHHLPAAAELGRRYAAATSLQGELYAPYLGLAGMAGLLLVIGAEIRRRLAGRASFRCAHATTIVFLTGFFIVGGLNSILAFAGFDLFRAGNRYSIYLLAIALFALVGWAARRGRRLGPAAAGALTVAAVLVGLWDQLPRARPAEETAAVARKVAADQRIAAALGKMLPPHAAVFELPAVPFLEQPPVNGMTDYELFRPWLFASGLRFSYGLLAGDRLLRWQRWVASEPADALCAALERAGFAAVYFHKAAFADSGAALRGQLTALGKKLLVESDDQAVFALQPAALPEAPNLDDPRLADAWDPASDEAAGPRRLATFGWFALERDSRDAWRWAGSAATLDLWCPGHEPVPVVVEFSCASLQDARLTATFAGREIWNASVTGTPTAPARLNLKLQPGANPIAFAYDGRPVEASTTDSRRLGFRLLNLRVTVGGGR